ncbi:MAG: ATP-binding cassette domain-containing protein [Kofleriaceae bacterium]|nr:ATP-binding cassette domain-containing protein [Kofleriaceae bacterium]
MIELQGVRLDHPRNGEPLLRSLDLSVGAGQVVVVHAGAGAGATRLMAVLAGEALADEGQVSVLGRDLARLRRSAQRVLRRSLGVVPQDLCLLLDRSALLNVTMPLEIDGVPRQAALVRAAELLGALGVAAEADEPMAHQPHSVRQRVAVARALVRRPQVLLCDQPTSLQDEAGAELVCAAIAGAAAAGASCLVLARDPMLLTQAVRRGWAVRVLQGGVLQDEGTVPVPGPVEHDLDVSLDLLVSMVSAPTPQISEPEPDSDGVPNVVPFPNAAARSGRAALSDRPAPIAEAG